MAGHRVAHATLKGPSVVKELIIGMALGLAAGGLWKMHHWNEQRKTRAFYDLLERDRPETKWIICGAAIYIAALSHDIAEMGEETITYILNEFANTEAASLTVEELKKSDSILLEKPFTPRPNSDKEVVNCKHKDSKSFGYGLCKDCHEKFIEVSAAVCLSEESEASDESDNLSGLDGDPVESKNAPPASTAFEACTRMLESKGLVNYDLLKELLDPSRIKKKEDEEDPAEDEEQDKNVS